MLHWIDTLALVGILINLLKGADLLLRPNQQKWIQSKFESITLGLDDLRPIQWYSKLRQAFVVEIIYMLTALIVFFRMSAIIRWLIDLVPPLAASKAPPWWAYVLVFVIMVLIFDSKYRSQEAIDWILCKNRPHDETIDPLFFVLRFVAVLLRFVAVICLIVALVYGMLALVLTKKLSFVPISSYQYKLFILAMFPAIPHVLSLLTVIPACTIITVTIIFVWSLELLLKGCRAFCWRVVEYNKGAVAALALVMTIGLGVFDLYLRAGGHH